MDNKTLAGLRCRIDVLNRDMVKLLAQRMRLGLRVAQTKEKLGLPGLDRAREAVVIRKVRHLGRKEKLNPEIPRGIEAEHRQLEPKDRKDPREKKTACSQGFENQAEDGSHRRPG